MDGLIQDMLSQGVIIPSSSPHLSEELVREVHAGKFGDHLSDAKAYSEIQRHYWWVGMRKDITQWTRGCLVCVTRSTGRAVRPPLSPIPVSSPLDRTSVDSNRRSVVTTMQLSLLTF